MRHLRRALSPGIPFLLSAAGPRIPCLAAGLAGLVMAGSAAAFPSPCEPPDGERRLLLGAERGEAEELRESGGAESRLTRSRVDWRGMVGRSGIAAGAGHEYSIFDITPFAPLSGAPAPEPSANGHLHVLYAEAAFAPLLPPGWDLRLQPALAVSSNFLKEPAGIGREALQLNAVLLRRFGAGERWRAGLCGDHRFGDWRVYPVLAWEWERGPWSLRLGWPGNRVARRLGGELETSIALAPGGNRWRVLDEALGDSRFVHEAWRLDWSLDWRPARRWSARLHASLMLESEYAFLLDTGERYAGDSGTPLQVGLSLRWHYED